MPPDSTRSSDSYSQPSPGSNALAYAGEGLNLATALSQRSLRPITQEEAWNQHGHANRYEALVASLYSYSGVPNTQWKQAESEFSSMAAVTVRSGGSAASSEYGSSVYSVQYPPSLASGSTLLTGSSIRTSDADDNVWQGNQLEPGPSEILQRADSRGTLACTYHFLGCESVFEYDRSSEWDTHCKSHFKLASGGALPRSVSCPFTCEWTYSAAAGEEAWSQRNAHILSKHRIDEERVDANRRAEVSLIQHLWKHHLIDERETRQLKTTGKLEQNQIFVRNDGTMRERRQERRERAGHGYQTNVQNKGGSLGRPESAQSPPTGRWI